MVHTEDMEVNILVNGISQIELADSIQVANYITKSYNFPTSSNWLITGASGFLGSQVLNVLSAIKNLGYECQVTAMDSGSRGGLRSWYFQDTNFFQHDITKEWPDLDPHSYILHFASIASPPYYRKFPLETLDANYSGTLNALKMANKWKSKILLMSSSEIYGDPPSNCIPTDESYRGNVSSIGPRACYDEGKRVMETLGWIFETSHGVDVSIIRPFNFYGPGMRLDDGRVLPDFFGSVSRGEDLILHSNGKPTRSFCYSSDALTGIFAVVLLNAKEKIFNVGNSDVEISMADLAELVAHEARTLGWNGSIKHAPSKDQNYLVNNPNRRVPNLRRINQYADWKAHVTLQDGINRSLRHFLEVEK